jgi:hypothetical protein
MLSYADSVDITVMRIKTMNQKYSKKQRQHLRELAADCHEIELEVAMEELYEQFQKWGGKGLNVFELNDLVHEFHNGVSRELYKRYVMTDPYFSVAYALNNNILNESSVDKEVLKLLGNMLIAEQ